MRYLVSVDDTSRTVTREGLAAWPMDPEDRAKVLHMIGSLQASSSRYGIILREWPRFRVQELGA